LLAQASKGASIYQKSIPLAPGTYRINSVSKDVVGGNMNNYEMALHVPRYDESKLGTSSIILADLIEKVPTRSSDGPVVIGTEGAATDRRDLPAHRENGHYLQLYNFHVDQVSRSQTPPLLRGRQEYEHKMIFQFEGGHVDRRLVGHSDRRREGPVGESRTRAVHAENEVTDKVRMKS
jgi:hypothetical protein